MSETVKSKRKNGKTELLEFLQTLETPLKPKLHINGSEFYGCILTVDFGQPLEPPVLSQQEEEKLKDIMRSTARWVIGKDFNIRISHDPEGGVWWASL